MSTSNNQGGMTAMVRWNKTFKMHRTPKWLNKKLKAYSILKDKEINFPMHHIESGDFKPLFDHWGRVEICYRDMLITQPYAAIAQMDEDASRFADIFNLGMAIRDGVWNKGTIMYVFWEKKYQEGLIKRSEILKAIDRNGQ
jgi:hypothetical protein